MFEHYSQGRSATCAIAGALLLLSACTGTLGPDLTAGGGAGTSQGRNADGDGADDEGDPAADDKDDKDDKGDSEGGSMVDNDSGSSSDDADCDLDGPPKVGEARLRRLTHGELERSILDLLGVQINARDNLVPDERVGDTFASNVDSDVQILHAERYLAVFEWVAEKTDVGAVLECDLASAAESPEQANGAATPCMERFISRVVRRAYRRPLTADERERYVATYAELRAEDDATASFRVLIAGMLQTPHFLYHIEVADTESDAPAGSIAKLSKYALAERLSFLLWGSIPDEALLDAAEMGALDTDAGMVEQAARLLQDDRAKGALADFHSQWLGLPKLDYQTRSSDLFPEWNEELVSALNGELASYVDYMIREREAGFAELLTEPVSMPQGPGLSLLGPDEGEDRGDGIYDMNPAMRAGLLTQPAFLAAHSHSDQTSPVLRGKAVRERFFCQLLPDPPPEVLAEPPKLEEGLTTRERYAAHRTAGSACAGCHALIDDLGFALEQFDAIGRFRSEENGLPLDTSGELRGTDVNGDIDGAVQLAGTLGDSEMARDCYATQWFRYAFGRSEQPEDACTVQRLQESLADGGRVLSLLEALVTSDSFVYHRIEE